MYIMRFKLIIFRFHKFFCLLSFSLRLTQIFIHAIDAVVVFVIIRTIFYIVNAIIISTIYFLIIDNIIKAILP